MKNSQNYQLCRTNVFLGGQMKYDLIVGRNNEDLIVKDFHITPISKSCPFNIHIQDNLLKYTHQENISRYYKQISGSFYKDFIKTTLYPSSDKSKHDDTYEMGCKRMSYKLYNKQFEFLCPVWIEEIKGNEHLDFQFNIYGVEGDSPIITKKLKLEILKNPDNTSVEYHNRLVEYFQNYFNYVGISGDNNTGGNDNVMNILPSKNFASISGLNVSTGIKQTKIIPNLIQNMFNREIPLMEFDHLLIRNFEDNKLITNQLFNFNICFNVDDIISPKLYSMMMGSNLRIEIIVSISDDDKSIKLKTMDLYTNYEFIPKKKYYIPKYTYSFENNAFKEVVPKTQESEVNVLDYLRDNQNIDYLSKNKLSQQVIHWSLNDNNNYICNAYNGFSSYYLLNGNIKNASHLYDNTANILLRNNSPEQNSLNWCNMIKLDEKQILESNILHAYSEYFKNLCSVFNLKEISWVNNIKYKHLLSEPTTNTISILFIEVSDDQLNRLEDVIDLKEEWDGIRLWELSSTRNSDDYIILFINSIDKLTYLNTIEIFQQLHGDSESESKYGLMSDFMNANKNLDDLEIICSPTSLTIYKANSPSQATQEVLYYKNDKRGGEYVMRYFGKIKPTFIDLENDINFNYRYSTIDLNNGLNNYKKYQSTGYTPIYPSIGYYFIDSVKETYEPKENGFIGEYQNILKPFEYKYFKYNRIKVMYPTILINIEDKNEISQNLITKQLKYIYPNHGKEEIEYIYSLYDINYDLICRTEDKYKHKIELTLK